MRRAARFVLVVLLATGCGGSDPVESAENCTELTQAWADGDQSDQDFKDDVVAKATQLAGDAVDRGADTEAGVCGIVLQEVAEHFDTIPPFDIDFDPFG